MSAATAGPLTSGQARTGRRPAARREEATPRVRLVAPPASSRRRVPFGALCGLLLVASLVTVLLLNISLSHGAYALHEVEIQQAGVDERRQALVEQLEQEASPARLGARAEDLGMVLVVSPTFLRLVDGAVLGAAEAGRPADPADPADPAVGAAGDVAVAPPPDDVPADEPADAGGAAQEQPRPDADADAGATAETRTDEETAP